MSDRQKDKIACGRDKGKPATVGRWDAPEAPQEIPLPAFLPEIVSPLRRISSQGMYPRNFPLGKRHEYTPLRHLDLMTHGESPTSK